MLEKLVGAVYYRSADYTARQASRCWQLYMLTGNLRMLRMAVKWHRRVAEVYPRELPAGYAECLSNLGIVLRTWAERTGENGYLDEALRVAQEACRVVPDHEPVRAVCLSNCSATLLARYERSGSPADLEDAIAVGRDAVAATPAGDRRRAVRLSYLADGLHRHFEACGDLAAIREAAEARRAAIHESSEDDPDLPVHMSNFGATQGLLAHHIGSEQALREALAAGQEALNRASYDDPRLPEFLSNLAATWGHSYALSGKVDHLQQSIATIRKAVASATAAGDQRRAVYLSNLAQGLSSLYEHTRELHVLQEAVQASRAAVDAAPDGSVNRCQYLANLATTLRNLADRTGDREKLAEAERAIRSALDHNVAPSGHHARAILLTRLAGILMDEFNWAGRQDTPAGTGKAADLGALEEARRVSYAAVEAAPPGSPAQAGCMANLGSVLLAWSDLHPRQPEPLQEAIEVMGRCVALTPEGTRDRAVYSGKLGLALIRRFERTGDRQALSDAQAVLASGAKSDEADAAVRVMARRLQARAEMLAGDPKSAWTVMREVLRLLPDVAPRDLRRQDREYRLAEVSGIGAQAASYALSAGKRPERALEALEEARGLLMAETLADRRTGGGLELLGQAGPGPVAVLSTDPDRCDALIFVPGQPEPVRHVPLQELSHRTASEHAAYLLDPRSRHRPDYNQQLRHILGWLWDTTAAPVLEALGCQQTPGPRQPWPRLWWCPIGPLAYLPVHAAGHHEDLLRGLSHPRTVLDRVISSYTATIRALAYVREQIPLPDSHDEHAALVIAMPATPGEDALGAVHEEVGSLRRLLPGSRILEGPRATYGTVLKNLPRYPLAHFACHCLDDEDDPGASYLLLNDHKENPLTVAAISGLHLPRGRLAYLSACSTTRTSPSYADESIHVTAAFQIAGYRNVIGTLWPVQDSAAAKIATDFYTYLTRNGCQAPDTGESAHALHHAIRAFRASSLSPGVYALRLPSLWAAHIHVGG